MENHSSGKRRIFIVATLFVAIICNYLDRQLLSILKPEILEYFGIGDIQYAWIVNVFLICYAIMYPISGILVDKFGPKPVISVGIVVWSLACIGGGLSTNAVLFATFRGILGLAEPTIIAGQIVAVTVWFEKRHRATANARGQYTTEDPDVIAAMEKSASFGTTYKCIHTETFGDPTPAPRTKAAPKIQDPDPDEATAEGNDEAGKEDPNAGNDTGVTEVPGIATIQAAREYLVANCGATASKLPNGPAVKKFAAEKKINFVDLQ